MFYDIFIVFCVGCISLWITFQWKMRLTFKRLKNLPYASRSYPFLGSALLVFNKSPEELCDILSRIFKSTWDTATQLWLGPVCIVTVGKPEDIAAITTSPNSLEKHFIYKFFKVNTGIIASPVNVWRPDRKILNPTFSPRILQSFIPIFSESSKVLVTNLEKKIGQEFDICKDLYACTLEMVCRTTLGYNLNVQQNQNVKYLNATHRFLELVNARFFKVYLYPEFLYKLTTAYKEEAESIQIMNDLFTKIVKEKREELKQLSENENIKENTLIEDTGYKRPSIFLEHILRLAADNRFTDENIRDQMETIIIAGTETSAVTVSFILLMLAMHPEIQDRVYEEIQEYYTEDDLDYSYLSKITYTDMAIKESQRLHSSSPYVARVTTGDVELSNCTIPSGVFVLISFHHLHRNPNVWGPNADKYDPDNFLPEKVEKRHPASFAPFSLGPRACIGMKYGSLAIKILVVELLMNYKFKTTLKMEELRFAFDITMKLTNGFNITIEKRSKK